jgi:hypothetical protein
MTGLRVLLEGEQFHCMLNAFGFLWQFLLGNTCLEGKQTKIVVSHLPF